MWGRDRSRVWPQDREQTRGRWISSRRPAPLRQFIADWMRPRGVEASADTIMVTAGSTQGIEAICRVMLDPGDTVIVPAKD